MILKNTNNFAFKRFFFPQILLIDEPGIIYNKTIKKFGRKQKRTRVAYYFEDIYSKLYFDTLKEIGKEKTAWLWYKIGKDIAYRYLLFFDPKKIKEENVNIILEYILRNIESSGFTFSKKFAYDKKIKEFKSIGENSLICRKTKEGSFSAGIISGLLSFIINKNIEMKAICKNCPSVCRIVNYNTKSIYIPDKKRLLPSKDYEKINFKKRKFPLRDLNSITDLIKFNKIKIDKKKNKILFYEKTILTSEIGLGELFMENYKNISREELFKKSIIKSSEKIFRDITVNKTKERKIKQLNNIISAFGWGIPYLREKGEKVILDLINPPFTKYNFSHINYIINGFLNEIFKKKFQINQNIKLNKIEFY